jgi:hypothetical protein
MQQFTHGAAAIAHKITGGSVVPVQVITGGYRVVSPNSGNCRRSRLDLERQYYGNKSKFRIAGTKCQNEMIGSM